MQAKHIALQAERPLRWAMHVGAIVILGLIMISGILPSTEGSPSQGDGCAWIDAVRLLCCVPYVCPLLEELPRPPPGGESS